METKLSNINSIIDDRRLNRVVAFSIAVILFCLSSLTLTTYAWYKSSVTSDANIIRSANTNQLGVSVAPVNSDPSSNPSGAKSGNEIFSATVNMANPATLSDLPAGEYTVTVTPESTDEFTIESFMRFIVNDVNQPKASLPKTYATDVLRAERGGSYTYRLTVEEDGGSITFAPYWGSPETFGYEDKNIIDNDAQLDVNDASQVSDGISFGLLYYFHEDQYIRVGNKGVVHLGDIFYSNYPMDVESTNVYVTTRALFNDSSISAGGTADCIYNVNPENWQLSTLMFTGEGPVEVSIQYGAGENARVYKVNFEVINAENFKGEVKTEDFEKKDAVLIGDVSLKGTLVEFDGKHIYGNGLTLDVSGVRTFTNHGIIVLKNGASIDNTKVVGPSFSEIDNMHQYVTVLSDGGSITNSFVSGGYAPVRAKGESLLKNVKLYGGSFACAEIVSGTLTVNGLTTVNDSAPGIAFASNATRHTKLIIAGGLQQYNFLKSGTLVGGVYEYESAFIANVFSSHLEFVFNTEEGESYANFGIVSYSSAVDSSRIDDRRGDKKGYAFVDGSASEYYSFAYMPAASEGAAPDLSYPAEFNTSANTPYAPVFTWSLGSQAGTYENASCFVDSDGNISLVIREGWPFVLDLSALPSITKYGAHTVRVGSIACSGPNGSLTVSNGECSFALEGAYNITYSYTDDLVFGQSSSSTTYTNTITVVVSFMP